MAPEMLAFQKEYEKRLSRVENTTDNAHLRLNNQDEFIKEIRETNRELAITNKGMAVMNSNVLVIAEQIKNLNQGFIRHEKAIDDIQGSMETKDTVLSLYATIKDNNEQYKKGMDDIMDKLRATDKVLEDHIEQPAKEALEREKSLRKWVVVGVGTILLSIASGFILMYLGLR